MFSNKFSCFGLEVLKFCLKLKYYFSKGYPCTIRTIFYPLLGDGTWGAMGDVIDISAVFGTLFGSRFFISAVFGAE